MALDQETEMSPEQTDAFLGRHETGVLSLADGGDPYAIPISYGFDPGGRRLYFRLVSTPESEKRAFLASSPAARLVVYDEDGDTYRSVVAKGDLQEIPREELSVEHVEQYGDAKRPLFEVWGQSTPDLDVALYVLDPDDVSGREVVIEREG